MPLPNIIKICLSESKLWSAQDFGFRGDNYITKKKVRVVSLAHDTPTGPFVCVEVLWPSQSNGVMSSAVSLPNHTQVGLVL